MNRTVNYGREKQRNTTGIIGFVIILIMASICGLSGLFFYMDAASKASRARQREERFDPWEDGSQVQDAWKTWEIVGLTEEFAADFKETYHYYFAFDREWYPFIIKMKGDLREEYQPYMDYVYEEGAPQPEPMKVRGVAAPIEDDIREFAIESMNILYDDEFMTEDNFESYMGISFLDMTRKPGGKADSFIGRALLICGLVLGIVGAVPLVFIIWARRDLNLAEQRQRENMRRMAAWQNEPEEGDGAGQAGGQGTGGTAWQQPPEQPAGRQQPPSGDQAYHVNGVRLIPVRKSNVFLGILGAVGGSLVGVVLWIAISLIGFIAGIAGFVMLKFALKGYEKLSGKLDKKGALISLFIAALMVCFANVLDYIIALCRAFFEWAASLDTVRYVIVNFGTLMTDTESWGGFILNLILGYGLSIWASFGLIREILHYRER